MSCGGRQRLEAVLAGGGGLEESTTDTQKAIIEQLCHVVWRVLEKKQK